MHLGLGLAYEPKALRLRAEGLGLGLRFGLWFLSLGFRGDTEMSEIPRCRV